MVFCANRTVSAHSVRCAASFPMFDLFPAPLNPRQSVAPSTDQLRLPASLSAHRAFPRGYGASLPARTHLPASMALCPDACLFWPFRLSFSQALLTLLWKLDSR